MKWALRLLETGGDGHAGGTARKTAKSKPSKIQPPLTPLQRGARVVGKGIP
jgi:hypothetical protein